MSRQLICSFVQFSVDLHLSIVYNNSSGEIVNPLQNAKAERALLLKQKTEIERKLKAVDASIEIYEPVYGEDPEMPLLPESVIPKGLTDTVRALMQHNQGKLWSPTDMRDALVRFGHDFGDQVNPMASIHTVLKRITSGNDYGFSAVHGETGKLYKFDLGLKHESKSNQRAVAVVTATRRNETK